MHIIRWLFCVILISLFFLHSATQKLSARSNVKLRQQSIAQSAIDTGIHTILFLGNSITYAGSYITDMETWFSVQHPGPRPEFINIGLPSETVSGLSEPGHADGKFPRPDLHERLHRILEKIKPDLIFATYGMNDGIYLPFDGGRFQKYTEGMQWLYDTLKKTGARVIIVTPSVYDEQRGNAKGYADVLNKYSDWLLKQRRSSGWEVIDTHYPMKKYLEAHRKIDAEFGTNGFELALDGIHPGETGHWLIARQLLLYLGEKDVVKYTGIKAVTEKSKNAPAIYKLVAERQSMMKDAWLTATGHQRPGMNTGLPLKEASDKATQIDEKIQVLQSTDSYNR